MSTVALGAPSQIWRRRLVDLMARLTERPARPTDPTGVEQDVIAHGNPGPSVGGSSDQPAGGGGSASDDQVEWLVEQHAPMVWRVAVSVLRDSALADDVTQEVLIKAWTSMPSWEDDVPARWMRRVARNTAISMLRSRSRLQNTDDIDTQTDLGADTERVVEGNAMAGAMLDALGQLDEESRTMIVVQHNDDASYDDLADLFGTTPSAVKARLYRARHAMKTALAEWDR